MDEITHLQVGCRGWRMCTPLLQLSHSHAKGIHEAYLYVAIEEAAHNLGIIW